MPSSTATLTDPTTSPPDTTTLDASVLVMCHDREELPPPQVRPEPVAVLCWD